MKFVHAAVVLIFLGIKCKNYGKSCNFLYLKGSLTPSLDAIHATHLARRFPTSTDSPRRQLFFSYCCRLPFCAGRLELFGDTAVIHHRLVELYRRPPHPFGLKVVVFLLRNHSTFKYSTLLFLLFLPISFPPLPPQCLECAGSLFFWKKKYIWWSMLCLRFEWREGGLLFPFTFLNPLYYLSSLGFLLSIAEVSWFRKKLCFF